MRCRRRVRRQGKTKEGVLVESVLRIIHRSIDRLLQRVNVGHNKVILLLLFPQTAKRRAIPLTLVEMTAHKFPDIIILSVQGPLKILLKDQLEWEPKFFETLF